MKFDEAEAQHRLRSHDHGVLCTVHPVRGVDAVPAVYAVDIDGYVGIPVDSVKPKASIRLQRQRNLEADPRATLLIEHWDADDWSELWWVRAELWWEQGERDRAENLGDLLAERYRQYKDRPFDQVLVLRTVGLTGWAAATSGS